ncbi:MAG TPA: hypothetical protein VGE50_12125 [Gammaproteobacteria bacterium]
MDNTDWTLHSHITLDDKVACDVAKIACALKSLSVYTIEALEDNASEDLNIIVDEGIAAIRRIFIW